MYIFMDEMLELFKGQMNYTEIVNLTYKEALYLKDTRIKRLQKEREEMEKEREKMEKQREREARTIESNRTRSSITKK